jgi:hypothetical protein
MIRMRLVSFDPTSNLRVALNVNTLFGGLAALLLGLPRRAIILKEESLNILKRFESPGPKKTSSAYFF